MSKEVKILSLVSYKYLPAIMGGQKGIALFYHFFSPLAQLTCVTTQNNDTTFAKEYEVLNILSNKQIRYINIFYFFSLKKIIRSKKITHLILEQPFYGWLGILLKWYCGITLVVHSHNIEALRFKSIGKWWWRILWYYERFTYKKANLVFFIQDADREYGIEKLKLNPKKCFTITYGFELNKKPTNEERQASRKTILSQHAIASEEKILLFNGTLDYKPNLDALDIILNKINPALMLAENFKYKIIICGKNLPISYNELKSYSNKNIIYAGFVDDITLYFKAADIFINPVIDGGGIKTKLVEALGHNINVVTTASGAMGVPTTITGNKMKVVEDNNWEFFAQEIIKIDISSDIPEAFFEHFYWGNIVKKAVDILLK